MISGTGFRLIFGSSTGLLGAGTIDSKGGEGNAFELVTPSFSVRPTPSPAGK
jgi:hypothetical protein